MNTFINEHIPEQDTTHNPTNSDYDAPIDLAETFLRDHAKFPMFDGSQTCMLKALVLIIQFQVDFNLSNAVITSLMMIIFTFFLPNHLNPIFPKSYVELKKFMCVVGLGYQHIHCCPNDCIIYSGNYKDSQSYPVCKANSKGKKLSPKGKYLFCISLDMLLGFFPLLKM